MSAKQKVLFLDTTHPVLVEELEKAGFECILFPQCSREECLDIIEDYTGIIIRSRFIVDAEFLNRARKLKFIGRVGAGMESIDTVLAEKKGIRCFNSPEGNRDAVGEHALGMLLALLNKIVIADGEMRKGIRRREENRGVEIKGKTVGIIGYGNMGSSFAKKLSGFECRILAYDKYKSGFANDFVEECSLERLFEETDILSLHVPLTDETRYWVDEKFISSFRKDFYLINTARGKIVRTSSLIEALQSGKILGAALDVIEYESHSFEEFEAGTLPQDYYRLVAFPNVILTPHIAGWTVESKYKLAKVLADKIIATFSEK